MTKKPYEAPVVKKVKLEIKNATLSVCHSSTDSTPDYGSGCKLPTGCQS
jgi:hypothetical protein